MTNWTTISQNDSDKIWEKFDNDFSFNPSVDPTNWPSIKTDKPNIKLSIADLWGDNYDETKWFFLIKKGINSFVSISNPHEEIIVLDWQHKCFYVNPRNITVDAMLPTDKSSTVVPSFVPNGDYYIFITIDFENIWFGHPWEKTITIIGDKLIKAYNQADNEKY
ncbi:hypothetical protein CNR22_14770 [Sphingobacteriaceae bacterium]|nr:hypothetical protein CNR22_14770 [Sphingobacteriaceae bacterium]